MKLFFTAIMFCFLATTTFGQTVVGTWKTIDDETGLARSYVQVYKAQNGMYYGKITKLLNRQPDEEADPICAVCPKDDYRYNKKVIGMKIITKMKASGKSFSGGKILDPKSGKIYGCKMWLSDSNTLKVRGYLGPFYRTQTWHRIK